MSASALIQRIGKLAINSFSRGNIKSTPQLKEESFRQLRELVSSISPADLHLDTSILNDNSVPFPGEAPVLYTELFEDSDVTICVFILRNGVQMPMHDHPNMTGLLKVIHGAVSLQAYTLVSREEGEARGVWDATKHPAALISSADDPVVLYPVKDNVHEIRTVGGSAAFLDILAPPYGVDRYDRSVHRDCNYYAELHTGSNGSSANGGAVNGNSATSGDSVNGKAELNGGSSLVCLRRTDAPASFWCNRLEYSGPPLTGVIEDGEDF